MNDLISRRALLKQFALYGASPKITVPAKDVERIIMAQPPVEFDELKEIVNNESAQLDRWRSNLPV